MKSTKTLDYIVNERRYVVIFSDVAAKPLKLLGGLQGGNNRVESHYPINFYLKSLIPIYFIIGTKLF